VSVVTSDTIYNSIKNDISNLREKYLEAKILGQKSKSDAEHIALAH